MYHWTESTNNNTDNSLLVHYNCKSLYHYVLSGWDWIVTCYYSVVDILLGQNKDTSNILCGTITIFSSMTKITLGHFCLMKNISGIDQQFIHYMHPLVVSIILIMVSSWSAKISKRFSVVVSRGIIHATFISCTTQQSWETKGHKTTFYSVLKSLVAITCTSYVLLKYHHKHLSRRHQTLINYAINNTLNHQYYHKD